MAATAEELEGAIQEAIAPEFRERLLSRGQARAIIWRDGLLPEESPPFSNLLTYDLLSYGYSLLSLSLRLLEIRGNRDLARSGFEHAAGAIEAAVNKGPRNTSRDFHRFISAAAYHLGQFSARAFSMLQVGFSERNLAPIEQSLGLLMLRDLDALNDLTTSYRLSGTGSDETIVSLLQAQFERSEAGGQAFQPDTDEDQISAIDLALTDNFMAAMAIASLAMERGEVALAETAIARLRTGQTEAAALNLVPQWWCHRLAIYLLRELWGSSFHELLPKDLSPGGIADWVRLRDLYVALLFRRSRAEIELWPSQIDAAARAVRLNENLVVSLPTSAGKTRIAELCMLATLATGKRVVYITPLRALSAQTEVVLQRTFHPLGKSVSSLYGSIGTSAVDENLLKDRHIVVATPEKLDFALRNDPTLIEDVGLIVLDEGHMIGLGEREVRYEAQIQRLLKRSDAKTRRLVCLSAILPSGDQLTDFVEWLTGDSKGGLLQKQWRPTRLRYGEITWRSEYGRLDIRVDNEKTFVPKFITARVPPKGKRKTPFPRDQRELCLAAAWRLVEEGQSVLIFCPLRASVEPFAEAIVDLNERGVLESVLSREPTVLANALSIGSEWFDENHPILQCLNLGVAIHHGALPTPFRKEIERLLRLGILRVTISSPTLAQGLNLSATSLIVHALMRSGERISSSEFRNVVGRAGRAYIDLEGLVLHPMFDDQARRKRLWDEIIADESGHELESGLLRLVVTLLARMQRKLGTTDLEKLTEYVINNAAAWSFPAVASESPSNARIEEARWNQFLSTLDIAILSLVGEEDVATEGVEASLDAVLQSSLWEKRLNRRKEATQAVIKAGLKSRAKYIWRNSTTKQRRGYFLAGIGFDSGCELDKKADELTDLLIVANGALLAEDDEAAIDAITKFATIIFAVVPFVPDDLPKNWESLLRTWLTGKPIVGVASSDEALQFIEQALIYRLPWGMEAVRVRAIANDTKTSNGASLQDLELGLAVAAVEAGTLNRQAAILMRAGFNSRMAAIKSVLDTGAKFENAYELREWLHSERVAELSVAPDWPSKETAQLWTTFRSNFSSAAESVWRHQSADLAVHWRSPTSVVRPGTPVRVWTDKPGKPAMVLNAECDWIGTLERALNPERAGLLNASVKSDSKTLAAHYLGPDDLFV